MNNKYELIKKIKYNIVAWVGANCREYPIINTIQGVCGLLAFYQPVTGKWFYRARFQAQLRNLFRNLIIQNVFNKCNYYAHPEISFGCEFDSLKGSASRIRFYKPNEMFSVICTTDIYVQLYCIIQHHDIYKNEYKLCRFKKLHKYLLRK